MNSIQTRIICLNDKIKNTISVIIQKTKRSYVNKKFIIIQLNLIESNTIFLISLVYDKYLLFKQKFITFIIKRSRIMF